MSCSSSGEILEGARAIHVPTCSDSRFQKISILGQGNFGEAWLARSAVSGRNYVVKELKMTSALTPKDRERTFNEVNIIRKCCHVNIIRYKDCFIAPSGPGGAAVILGIVMEYADAGDLHHCIKKHREVKKLHFPEVPKIYA